MRIYDDITSGLEDEFQCDPDVDATDIVIALSNGVVGRAGSRSPVWRSISQPANDRTTTRQRSTGRRNKSG
jgi:hypothetical protein